MINSTFIGAIIGILLCIIYFIVVFSHKNRKADLTDIVLVILSAVATSSSSELGYVSLIESSQYLGNLADQRIAILLGSIAVIYVSISSIKKIFEPHIEKSVKK